MADDVDFQLNLLRMIAAATYFQAGLAAAREMFGIELIFVGGS